MRTTAARRIKWIKPPPKCNKNPSSQKMKSTEIIVQSMPAMGLVCPFSSKLKRPFRVGSLALSARASFPGSVTAGIREARHH